MTLDAGPKGEFFFRLFHLLKPVPQSTLSDPGPCVTAAASLQVRGGSSDVLQHHSPEAMTSTAPERPERGNGIPDSYKGIGNAGSRFLSHSLPLSLNRVAMGQAPTSSDQNR
jgi:hypothetical protein